MRRSAIWLAVIVLGMSMLVPVSGAHDNKRMDEVDDLSHKNEVRIHELNVLLGEVEDRLEQADRERADMMREIKELED